MPIRPTSRLAIVLLASWLCGAGCDVQSSATPADDGGTAQPGGDVRADDDRSEPADRPRHGPLVIVGGGATPEEATRRFVELAGGADARVVVLPMAGGSEDAASGDVADLRRAGVEAEVVFLTREQAADPAVRDRFKDVTGIWLSGGQQRDLMAVLHDTPAADAIRERHRAGAVVGGTSAGAAVMSRLMIVGGERRPSNTPSTDTGTYETIERDNVLTADGLGLLPGAVVDQHFLRRRRHNRLFSVVLEHPELLGVGIDESTALLVGADGSWEVVGDGQVMVLDAREARVTPEDAPALGAAGIRVHLLVSGSRFDPESGQIRLPHERDEAAN